MLTMSNILDTLTLTLHAFDRVQCGAWWNYPRVNSPFTRLFYTLAGEAFVRHGENTFALSPQTLVLTPPFASVDYWCPCSFESYYAIFTSRLGQGIDLFSCITPKWSIEITAGSETLFQRLHELNPDCRLFITDPACPDYNKQIWQLPESEHNLAVRLETDGILRQLLARFLAPPNGFFKPEFEDAQLVECFHYIDRHLARTITLSELAKKACMSPNYFSTYFQQNTGLRPSRYIQIS